MKRLSWLIAIAVTVWQVRAGMVRCGTIDGGVLIAPLVFATAYLAHGVIHTLKEAFNE